MSARQQPRGGQLTAAACSNFLRDPGYTDDDGRERQFTRLVANLDRRLPTSTRTEMPITLDSNARRSKA
jgi:hypothetical protein